MKKFYLTLALACGAISIQAALPHKAPVMMADAPETETAADWQTIGECAYTDDLATTFWSVGAQTFNVTVQEDALHPGMYRIVDPWKNYPAPERAAIENHEDYPGKLLTGDEYYILIDATNPEKVKIKPSPIGIVYEPISTDYNVQPPLTVQQHRNCTAYGKSELIGKYGISAESADKACGTLVDGVITFPERQAIYVISENADDSDDLDWHIGNRYGSFQLVLTGTTVPVNYDFSVVTKTAYCPSEAGNYQFYVLGDENIPVLRYAVVYEWPDHPVAADECIQTGKNIRPDDVIVVSTKGMPARCAHVYIMAADAEGTLKKAQYFEVFNPEFEADQWETFSDGTMTEGFLSSLYPTLFKSADFTVEIQKHKTRKDYYRVVNPYEKFAEAEQYLTYGHGHDHHIYINASDPDNVYIERSTLGLEVLESELYLGHDWSDLIWMWGSDDYESDKNFFEMYFGVSSSGSSFKDGVLTFGPSAGLYLSLSGGALYDTNVTPNPDFNLEAYQNAQAAGIPYNVAPYLPGNFKLTINKLAENSIDAIKAENPDAPVYDLQGRRVNNPSAPGLYIINGKKILK
ncbi:MAG: hypothetical protein HDS64_10370 [Bacteroidales bacterium]|nr:hypothetical protein [Bacteroidales bacterium]